MVLSLELVSPPSPTADPATWAILSRLTRITHLSIVDMCWAYCYAEDRALLRSAFAQVTHLTLGLCRWRHVEDFLSFLSAFPNVATLILEDPTTLSEEQMDLAVFPRQIVGAIPGAALCKLEFAWTRSSFLSQSASLLADPNLRELVGLWLSHLSSIVPNGLDVQWTSFTGWLGFPEYIRAMGPVLTDLKIMMVFHDSVPPDFGMTACTSLRSIAFDGVCYQDDIWLASSAEYSWVPRMLAQVRSPRIDAV
ncbi:hypothetical protein PsYK624_157360 [Phanerochaete sordida]|uniref:Uncharacterized protein n=1 Tax=Phanerochaete sordida TaxID=48140 RepID=A0A9P3GQ47_9APHY|nr:hypothetical protein PsYK624_157360 [Phanerochaete sordida]